MFSNEIGDLKSKFKGALMLFEGLSLDLVRRLTWAEGQSDLNLMA